MRTIKMISTAVLIGLFLIMSTGMQAQDPMTAGPKVYKKILLNNDKVRVMSVEFAPGQMMPTHSHPHHTVYALTDGTIEITEKGKPATTAKFKMGDVLYFTPVTHKGKNVGKNTIKLVVTEIKPAPKKK
ncbi:cupin domain-containing protein [Flavobacterium sp. XS2P39]|uniref:cupin domain-containing protein n=1 Tax=Flavobacterium sp. XS2P39 TaxID=3401725 RepID=UPI003AB0A331